MNAVLQDLLPAAVGLMLSIIAIIAIVVMLTSTGGKRKAWFFLIGWMVGLMVVLSIFGLIGGKIAKPDSSIDATIAQVLKLLFGLALLFLSYKTFMSGRGSEHKTPKWLAGIDKTSPIMAAGLGAGLATFLNAKNLPIVLTMGTDLAAAKLPAGEVLITALILTIISSLGVAAPVMITVFDRKGADAILAKLRTWLIAHNAAITGSLFLLLGINFAGKAILTLIQHK